MSENEPALTPAPLYLKIPVFRLIFLSIVSFGIYEAYWIYKNWKYIKNREGLYILPFWRGVFGIFFCHSLFHQIHEEREARSMQMPAFSPDGLATGWIILIIISNLVSRLPGMATTILSAFIPSFLCLVPVQKYINDVEEQRRPGQRYYGWSWGHIFCLVIGLIGWGLILLGKVPE
jgi:hypothetical protein